MYQFIFFLLAIAMTHWIAEYIGKKREIGYGQSVFYSVMLTPILGLVITLLSKRLGN